MKQSGTKATNADFKGEYQAALAYYKQTVWNYVHETPLLGAQYDIALLAFRRMEGAVHEWVYELEPSLPPDEERKTRETEKQKLEELRPRPLQHDETVTPEILATLAASRLGTKKPKSLRHAVEEAHRLLLTTREYLDALRKPQSHERELFAEARDHLYSKRIKPPPGWEDYMDACLFKHVSFEDIEESTGKSDCVPLLGTVQKARNDGKLTLKAIEQAVKRFGEESTEREVQSEIKAAIKSKTISCRLLEEIRWNRFRKHYQK